MGSGGESNGKLLESGSGSKAVRYNQVVFEDDLPASLVSFAEQNGISLVSHSDELGALRFCQVVLRVMLISRPAGTQRQFVNLLLEFKDRLPLPEKMKSGSFKDVSEVFRMKWVLKVSELPDLLYPSSIA